MSPAIDQPDLQCLRIISLVVDGMLVMLIGLVHCIIYPAFRLIDRDQFQDWHLVYMRRITCFVGPPILIQVALAGLLCVKQFDWFRVLALFAISIAWGATAFGAAPTHTALTRGYSDQKLDRLLRWNAVRAWAWLATFIFGSVAYWRFAQSANLS